MNDVITAIVCIAGATYLVSLKGDHAAGVAILIGIAAQAYSHYRSSQNIAGKVDELAQKSDTNNSPPTTA